MEPSYFIILLARRLGINYILVWFRGARKGTTSRVPKAGCYDTDFLSRTMEMVLDTGFRYTKLEFKRLSNVRLQVREVFTTWIRGMGSLLWYRDGIGDVIGSLNMEI